MSASGTVRPFQLSARGVSEQQSHAALDLVCDLSEDGVRRRVAAIGGGGVGDAPMRRNRRPGELRADLAHLVAERDDSVEPGAGEAGERLRRATRDVDTA